MNHTLFALALRYRAFYLDIRRKDIDLTSPMTPTVAAFLRELRGNGYCVSEELLRALCGVPQQELQEATGILNEVLRTQLNWMPLVRGWQVPTGERRIDHLITLLANVLPGHGGLQGATLPCGHFIPEGTFPLERYNGCPFCGTPFMTSNAIRRGQGTKLQELRLFTHDDMRRVFLSLLTSTAPLDATQQDTLRQLLYTFVIPSGTQIAMRETVMLVVTALAEQERDAEAAAFLRSPTDILRYLWYRKTGHLQVIPPQVIARNAGMAHSHAWMPAHHRAQVMDRKLMELHLRYDRRWCRRVATWIEQLPMTARQAAETMHAHRGMWVRFIRALRLTEMARKPAYPHLRELLDVFYRQDYCVWQGQVDTSLRAADAAATLRLLSQRPGAFARCLFATMLHLGPDVVLTAFDAVADQVPARLLISLANTAETYFNPEEKRAARTITGHTHVLPSHPLLQRYTPRQRRQMVDGIRQLYKDSFRRRYQTMPTPARTIFIHPDLFHVPVPVGDRSGTVQDLAGALPGMRFAVEGDAVRLFMQWGVGLPAQHLDMDLSCRIIFEDDIHEDCAYYNLAPNGARHSGDIRSIPDQVGTAEYIELDLPRLQELDALYALFTCNAYSQGNLSPNLVVGWMSCEQPMAVSEATGVAYDPSTVQHRVRVTENNLSKGLLFGILDVRARRIIWMEIPFSGQTINSLNIEAVQVMLRRMEEKISIGQMLELKAAAQGLRRVEAPQPATDDEPASEDYTLEWATDIAAVTALLCPE